MPITIGANPDFSWSHSRDRLLENDCARRYYWHYYGAHLGWQEDADEQTKLAYRLKQLQTLPMVLGLQIHERAREIAMAIREGRDPPGFEECRERTRGELNRVWRGSKDMKAFLRSPKRNPMLVGAYYGQSPSNDYLARMRDKMKRCLTNLCAWPGWVEMERLGPDEILLFEATEPIEHDGVRLYAAPDLVFRGEGQQWQILDWKTGQTEGAEDQLATYALYLRERGALPDFDGEACGRIVNLDESEDRRIEITPERLDQAAKRIRDSVWQMGGYVVGLDIERNDALPRDRFPIPVDTDRCRFCPFYELCEGDLRNAQHFGPF